MEWKCGRRKRDTCFVDDETSQEGIIYRNGLSESEESGKEVLDGNTKEQYNHEDTVMESIKPNSIVCYDYLSKTENVESANQWAEWESDG